MKIQASKMLQNLRFLTVFIVGLTVSIVGFADELDTTWRVNDEPLFTNYIICKSPEAAGVAATLKDEQFAQFFIPMVQNKECIFFQAAVLRLTDYHSGPYTDGEADWDVWEAKLGDWFTGYLPVPRNTGPHRATSASSDR